MYLLSSSVFFGPYLDFIHGVLLFNLIINEKKLIQKATFKLLKTNQTPVMSDRVSSLINQKLNYQDVFQMSREFRESPMNA